MHATYYSSSTLTTAESPSLPLPAPALLTTNHKKFASFLGIGSDAVWASASESVKRVREVTTSESIDSGLGNSASFVVRWAGMLALEHGALSRKFQWSGMPPADRFRLWLDNNLVIDQWTSLAHATPSAVFKFPMIHRRYDVNVEWFRSNTTNVSSSPELLECNVASKWIDCPACQLVYDCSSELSRIGTSRLFFSYSLLGSPIEVTVDAASEC